MQETERANLKRVARVDRVSAETAPGRQPQDQRLTVPRLSDAPRKVEILKENTMTSKNSKKSQRLECWLVTMQVNHTRRFRTVPVMAYTQKEAWNIAATQVTGRVTSIKMLPEIA